VGFEQARRVASGIASAAQALDSALLVSREATCGLACGAYKNPLDQARGPIMVVLHAGRRRPVRNLQCRWRLRYSAARVTCVRRKSTAPATVVAIWGCAKHQIFV
jgi:hypothetical protein